MMMPALLARSFIRVLALFLEARVAGADPLVHEQDLRLQRRGDGEGEASAHALAVALERHVDELAELENSMISSVRASISASLQPLMRPRSRMLRRPVASGAEAQVDVEQRIDPAVDIDLAGVRLVDAVEAP